MIYVDDADAALKQAANGKSPNPGGKVQLYQRGDGGAWQCSASVAGKQRRTTTKQESLSLAKQVAEDWYLELRGKDRAGIFLSEKTALSVRVTPPHIELLAPLYAPLQTEA